MKAARLALLALACSVPLAASAQWMWVDGHGRKVFSDKAPPPEITPDHILKAPRGAAAAAITAPTAQDTAAAPVAALPKPLGKDKALEERKNQLAAREAQKRKDEDAKVAAARQDNCVRARSAKANYESGVRMTRVDGKGERQFIGDSERAAEIRRMDEVIARDCVQ